MFASKSVSCSESAVGEKTAVGTDDSSTFRQTGELPICFFMKMFHLSHLSFWFANSISSLARLLIDHTVLHYEADALHSRDVLRRILGHSDDVRKHSYLDDPKLVWHA